MKKICTLILVIAAVFLQGCKEDQIVPQPKCLAGIDTQTAMKAAEKVLVRMDFVIDKSDANLALMTTRPLTGAQFFEFWRKDNVGGYNTALSSMGTLQRTAQLSFKEQNGSDCIDCVVKVQRLSLPEKEIDSAGRTYSMFSKSSSMEERLSINKDQRNKMEWIDIGRDNALEKRILNYIEIQINKDATMKGKKK